MRHEPTPSVDLSTTYLGLPLRSPLIASAGPLTGDPRNWDVLERAGVGAIVLPSMFEEQIDQEAFEFEDAFDADGAPVEAPDYVPELDLHPTRPDHHLRLVERARKELTIPVIASLNGTSNGGWVRYARYLESAGASAIELNVYDVITDPERDAASVERRYVDLVGEVQANIGIPLAVKLAPWFTALPHFAVELHAAGADGLVLFNRLYQPDIDLETMSIRAHLQLSTSAELSLPLHWIGILRRLQTCSLAGSTGVHSGADALKLLLAGADAVMTTAALLVNGPAYAATMLRSMRDWMQEHGFATVEQLKGSVGLHNVPDPGAYERANYFQVIHSWP